MKKPVIAVHFGDHSLEHPVSPLSSQAVLSAAKVLRRKEGLLP